MNEGPKLRLLATFHLSDGHTIKVAEIQDGDECPFAVLDVPIHRPEWWEVAAQGGFPRYKAAADAMRYALDSAGWLHVVCDEQETARRTSHP